MTRGAAKFRRGRQRGFSLVEVAIVLTIAGLMMSGFLEFYSLQIKKTRIETTRNRLESLRNALTNYVTTHDRLPCPQSPAGMPRPKDGDDPCAEGAEKLAPGVVAAVVGDPPVGRDPQQEVWIGTVPTQELRLPAEQGLDGWGDAFTYAVSRKLTLPKAMRGNPVPVGIISVENENGSSILDVPGTARYVVLSHGPSGAGAWTAQGGKLPCLPGTLSAKNCRINGRFVLAPFSQADGPRYFDNYLIYDGSDAGGNLLTRIAVCNRKRRYYIPTDETSDGDGCVRDKGTWQGACLQQIIVDSNGALLPAMPYSVMPPAVAKDSECACAPGYEVVKLGTSYDTSPLVSAPDHPPLSPDSTRQHTQTSLYTCTQP